MRTLDELFNKIATSDSEEIKEEFLASVKDKEGLQAFLKKYDCPATVEEFQAYLQEKAAQNAAVSDEELSAVSGGDWWSFGIVSVLTGVLGCVCHAYVSNKIENAKAKALGKQFKDTDPVDIACNN